MIKVYGRMATPPKQYIDGSSLKVLLLDGIRDRAQGFSVSGEGWTLCRVELEELQAALREKWDVLFLSSYFATKSWEPLIPLPTVIDAYREKRLRAVVLITPVAADGLRQYNALREAKVPTAYIPFDHLRPSHHEQVDL